MRAGRVEEAGQLAKLIGKQIARHCSQSLRHINGKADPKELWTAVRRLTGRAQEVNPPAGISAESLNSHYATTSTDRQYHPPRSSSLATTTLLTMFLNGKFSGSLTISNRQPLDLTFSQHGSYDWEPRFSVNLWLRCSTNHLQPQLCPSSGKPHGSNLFPKFLPRLSALTIGQYQ